MGIPIGTDQYTDIWLQQKLEALTEEAHRIQEFPDGQIQWTMAQQSLRHRVNHIYRGLPLSTVHAFKGQANELLLDIFACTCGYSKEEILAYCASEDRAAPLLYQLEAPVSLAGFDLLFSDIRADAAYVGAICSVHKEVIKHFSLNNGTLRFPAPESQEDVLDAVHRLGVVLSMPSLSLLEIMNGAVTDVPDGKFQRRLAAAAHLAAYEQFKMRVNKDIRIHLEQLEGPYSGSFLRARCKGITRLAHIVFEIAMTRRAGLPLKMVSRYVTCCCKKKEVLDRHGTHLIRCSAKNTWQKRHDSVVTTMVMLARMAGLPTVMNPIGDFNIIYDASALPASPPRTTITRDVSDSAADSDSATVSDITISSQEDSEAMLTNGTLARRRRGLQADIAIDNVGILKHIKTTLRSQRIVCDICVTDDGLVGKEKEKVKKYSAAAKRNNLLFIPLVFNTYGNWTSKVDDFIKGLSNHYTKKSCPTPEDLSTRLASYPVNRWRTMVSCAVHRAVGWQLLSRYNFLVNAGIPNSVSTSEHYQQRVSLTSSLDARCAN